jgi:hypothetical protein
MNNEIACINNLQFSQNRNFSIQEIAQKIIDDKDYYEKLVNGIPQKTPSRYPQYDYFFRLLKEFSYKRFVIKGLKLGALRGRYSEQDSISIEATDDGIFIPDLGKLDNDYRTYKILCEFGKIYLPEFEFFKRNQYKIEQEVKNIPLRKKREKEEKEKRRLEAIKIEEQAKKEEDQRIIDNLLKEQNNSIEKIDELLKELDKYIQQDQKISIEILKAINDHLKILYKQKDNLKDKKSVKDYESHFETSYKEAKKSSNFDEIIEQRMLDILRTFFEILETKNDDINMKVSEIEKAGNDKKFEVEFNKNINSLDKSITKLLSLFSNEKKLDFAELEVIENISISLVKQKNQINEKKSLERSKDCIESIWKEYLALDNYSSAVENNLKKILKNFYEIFDKSEEEINEIFAEQDMVKKIAIQNKNLNDFSKKLSELETCVRNNEPLNIEILQNLEELLKEIAKQKDIIQDKTKIQNDKVYFYTILKDYKKTKLSNTEKLRIQEIAKTFEEICKKTKKGIFSFLSH